MAAAAVAVAPTGLNGRTDDSRPATPLSAVSSSIKRKRDDSDDDDAAAADANGDGPVEAKPPTINGTYSARDVQAQIRDLFHVLQRCAIILPADPRRRGALTAPQQPRYRAVAPQAAAPRRLVVGRTGCQTPEAR